jgi:hypothetical protein
MPISLDDDPSLMPIETCRATMMMMVVAEDSDSKLYYDCDPCCSMG